MTDQPIQSGFSGKEAEIKAENGVINELRKNDPNAAYQRAVSNLERARETGIDELIMYCTFTLGCTALEYRPYPRLKEAIDAYDLASEKALVIGNKKIYASTQLNLGISYNHLQIGKIENLKNAIAYYKKALCIYNKKDFPYEYAKTQNHLGEAYRNLPTVDKSKNLKNAIACYENALCIYTEKEFPYDYACSQINLGNAYSELPPNEDRTENIKKAITCYNNSLKIFKKDDHLNYETVQNYATVQNNLGNAYSFLPTGDRAENLKIAIACYNNALEIHTEKDFPYEYARTQNNMGTAYNSLPTGDRSENLKRAISCYNNALKIRTENKFPYQYGITQTNLGVAFFELQTGDRAENLKKTIACYNNVLKVHTEKSFPYEYAMFIIIMHLKFILKKIFHMSMQKLKMILALFIMNYL